jgi:hypothetical protein
MGIKIIGDQTNSFSVMNEIAQRNFSLQNPVGEGFLSYLAKEAGFALK